MSWIDTNGNEQNDFIESGDIKDSIVEGFDNLQDYISESSEEIIDLAQRLGVRDTTDIETDPIHYKIKRYAIVFTIMRLCQDKTGKNNVELPDMEKYLIKYNMYKKELSELRSQITYEMVTGNIDEIRDRAIVSGTLYRG